MTPPNILWICTDQQRYDTINALGYSHVDTPHVDQLVRRGRGLYPRLLPKPDLYAEPCEFSHRPVR